MSTPAAGYDERYLKFFELFNERDFYECHEVLGGDGDFVPRPIGFARQSINQVRKAHDLSPFERELILRPCAKQAEKSFTEGVVRFAEQLCRLCARRHQRLSRRTVLASPFGS